MAQAKAKTKQPARKKKSKRTIGSGQMHIQATFNNTIITFTDSKGSVVASSSAGAAGFKGSRKGTAYAAQIASEKAAREAHDMGMKDVDVFVKGIGQGREAAIRSLHNVNIHVKSIKDVTGVPHNGCRPRKPRRI